MPASMPKGKSNGVLLVAPPHALPPALAAWLDSSLSAAADNDTAASVFECSSVLYQFPASPLEPALACCKAGPQCNE